MRTSSVVAGTTEGELAFGVSAESRVISSTFSLSTYQVARSVPEAGKAAASGNWRLLRDLSLPGGVPCGRQLCREAVALTRECRSPADEGRRPQDQGLRGRSHGRGRRSQARLRSRRPVATVRPRRGQHRLVESRVGKANGPSILASMVHRFYPGSVDNRGPDEVCPQDGGGGDCALGGDKGWLARGRQKCRSSRVRPDCVAISGFGPAGNLSATLGLAPAVAVLRAWRARGSPAASRRRTAAMSGVLRGSATRAGGRGLALRRRMTCR